MSSTKTSPIDKFERWFEKAKIHVKKDPNAMVLSTAHSGIPDSRVVLMKLFDENGFVFYTNYKSQKGRDLQLNPKCALLFYWPDLGRQVRIRGIAEKTSREESVAYFNSRPLLSRCASIVSQQSDELHFGKSIWLQLMHMCVDQSCPEHWGGFRVNPIQIEFWEEGKWRLHHREQFNRDGEKWTRRYLYP